MTGIFRAPVSGAVPGVIVIFGSSNAAGWGAGGVSGVNPSGPLWASPPTSWAGRLATALAPRGFTVINRSIGGSHTQPSIDRFWTDVAPHRPEFVFLATSLFNEPNALGSKAQCNAAAATYLRNIGTLIRMCESIGAKVVLKTQEPRNHNNGDAYAAAASVALSLCATGYPVADFTSVMDDGAGGFIAAAETIDGAHCGDVGHLHWYHAIDPSWFTSPGPASNIRQGGGAIALISANAYDGPQIEITSEYPLSSWCLSARIRPPASATSAKAFLGAYAYTDPAKTVRVRNPANVYEVATDSTTVITSTTNPTVDTTAREITLAYNSLKNSLTLHIDGIPIGSPASLGAGLAAEVTRFFVAGSSVGGGATDYAISGISLWRSPLSVGGIYIRQVTGVKPDQSAIFDVAAPYVAGVLANIAPGGVTGVINGNFAFA